MSAAPDPRRPGTPGPSRDLPAPYESPWGLLQRDLVAVIASLRLRAQELWRRNRQGDLVVPGGWPRDLAPLFWPLLLALALAGAVALPMLVVRDGPPSQPATPASEPPAPAADQPASPPSRVPVPAPPPAPSPAPTPASPLPELQLDPLLALLADDDPDQLIRSAHPNPALARLDLELRPRFAALPAARQRQLAEQWLARSEALGYEQLQLLDGSGQLLGRRARVGSGMILFPAIPEP